MRPCLPGSVNRMDFFYSRSTCCKHLGYMFHDIPESRIYSPVDISPMVFLNVLYVVTQVGILSHERAPNDVKQVGNSFAEGGHHAHLRV